MAYKATVKVFLMAYDAGAKKYIHVERRDMGMRFKVNNPSEIKEIGKKVFLERYQDVEVRNMNLTGRDSGNLYYVQKGELKKVVPMNSMR